MDLRRIRTSWWTAVALSAAVFLAYLFVTTRTSLTDTDESRFSRATVEMVQSGNYLYPTFNGNLRPDKPILIYWLMSIPVRLLGPTEMACRFFAPVGVALSCLLTWFIGVRLFSPRTGYLAMIILATTPLTLLVGGAATTDAVLLACITCSTAAFALTLVDGLKAWHVAVVGAAIGLALLTKGPVGLAIPLLSFAAMLLIAHGREPFSIRHLPYLLLAAGCGLVMFLAWGLPANAATKARFLELGIGLHVVDRSVEPLQHHGGDVLPYLPYYIPVVLLGFLPWSGFVPAAVSGLLGGRIAGKVGRAFLIGWILPTLILMTIVVTKLPHYILPIWPALALSVAAFVEVCEGGMMAPRDRLWLLVGMAVSTSISVVIGFMLLIGPAILPIQVPGLWVPSVLTGIVLILAGTIAFVQCVNGRIRAVVAVLAIGSVIVGGIIAVAVLPALDRPRVMPAIGRALQGRLKADTPVAAYRLRQASLNFYVGRRITYLSTDHDVREWARERQPGILIISRQALEEVEKDGDRLRLKEVARAEGIDYYKAQWLELAALSRPDE